MYAGPSSSVVPEASGTGYPAFFSFAAAESSPPLASFLDGQLQLLDERVLPTAEGATEPDGPRGVVHTVWRAALPLTSDVQPSVLLDLDDGEQVRLTDSPTLWWLPSSAWPAGQPIAIDFAGVPLRHLVAWHVELETANGSWPATAEAMRVVRNVTQIHPSFTMVEP